MLEVTTLGVLKGKNWQICSLDVSVCERNLFNFCVFAISLLLYYSLCLLHTIMLFFFLFGDPVWPCVILSEELCDNICTQLQCVPYLCSLGGRHGHGILPLSSVGGSEANSLASTA